MLLERSLRQWGWLVSRLIQNLSTSGAQTDRLVGSGGKKILAVGEVPIDHPLEGLAVLHFREVAQLKKHLSGLDSQIERWSAERRYLEYLDEINGGIFESRSEDVNYMIPCLIDQIEAAEIERMETIKRAAQAFRGFAEVEIRLLDFVY